MPKTIRLHHGIGPKISVYKKFLHPRALVSAKYPNASKGNVLDDLIASGQEEKRSASDDDFNDGQLLHAVFRYCKVQQEGALEHLLNDVQQDDSEAVGPVAACDEEVTLREVPSMLNEDVSNFRAQDFAVDDDNDPAPGNIPPQANDSSNNGQYFPWGAESLDVRRAMGVRDVQPRLVRADATWHTILGYFMRFLPMDFIKFVVIPATYTTISEAQTWDEFVRFLGFLFIMATTQTMLRRDLWSQDPPADMFSGAPFQSHSNMSRRRFKLILKRLKFTTKEPPTFKNPVHEVNDLIQGWNTHNSTLL